jgi:hypothetical protein
MDDGERVQFEDNPFVREDFFSFLFFYKKCLINLAWVIVCGIIIQLI